MKRFELATNAWIHWREGTSRQLLRTDANGVVFALRDGGETDNLFQYDKAFVAEIGATVDIAYGRMVFSASAAAFSAHAMGLRPDGWRGKGLSPRHQDRKA